MGQLLLFPPSVFGWDWETSWISSSSLLARYNFARDVTSAREGGKTSFRPEKLMDLEPHPGGRHRRRRPGRCSACPTATARPRSRSFTTICSQERTRTIPQPHQRAARSLRRRLPQHRSCTGSSRWCCSRPATRHTEDKAHGDHTTSVHQAHGVGRRWYAPRAAALQQSAASQGARRHRDPLLRGDFPRRRQRRSKYRRADGERRSARSGTTTTTIAARTAAASISTR